MLNLLKKTWKEEEFKKSQSPAPVLSREGSTFEHLAAPSSSELELIVDTPASSKPPNKRSRDTFETETRAPSVERPVKAIKTNPTDSIRNHLPEIVGSKHRDDEAFPVSLIALKDQIFEHAKENNTIAVLPVTKPSLNLLVDIATWNIEREQTKPKAFMAKPKTALFIVDEPSQVEKYSTVFEEYGPKIKIGKLTDEYNPPELHNWVQLVKNDIVIVTPNVLLQSLLRGAFAITQIHLMIITDAQTIRNQDSHPSMPIVQVMNEFYRVSDALGRPRVFALAPLATDRKSTFDSRMLKLEQTLDAKVFAVADDKREEILALPDRPDEVVILYDNLQRSTDTRLLKQLHLLDPTETIYRRHFRASRHAHDEVGQCASDLIWRRALKEMDRGGPWFEASDDEDEEAPSEEFVKAKIRNVVRNWAFNMPNLDASSKGFNVSHKFLRLVQILMTFKSYGDSFRGIIFVQRRAIALVLADLLRTLDDRLDFLRTQAVVGAGQSSDPNYYQETFHNFATGVFNLLIATKSIEDMDVPKASVVIRYDLFESQISHAYVRARTRGRESHLIHMVERGNDIHRRILSRITNLDAGMLRWTEALCSSQESAVPPQSLRESIDPYHSESEGEGEDATISFIKEPTTNGRIYTQDATTVLYRYAASVRPLADEISDSHKLFQFEDIDKLFGVPRAYRCAISLPGTPVNGISGDLAPSRADARRSACYKACECLYQANLLDCRLVPLPSKLRAQCEYETKRSTEKDAIPDVRAGGTRSYPRQQPTFWAQVQQVLPTKLYPLILYVDGVTESEGPYGPLVILTREPLPDFHVFRLFNSGTAIPIRSQRASPMFVEEDRMREIHSFSVRICRAVMNKALICQSEEMSYFFLPLPKDWSPPAKPELHIPDISVIVPWDVVALAAKHWAIPIKNESPEMIEMDLDDAIVQDRWIEFTRRYRVIQVRRDLTPMSKPADSVREINFDSLWDFCKSKRKGLETLKNNDQPIVEVAKIHAVLNHLNPTTKPPSGSSKFPAKYLIPELCAKFTVPASTMKTAMLLPSIMRRVDDLLLVKEMNARFFDHAVRDDLLHNALCAPSAGLEYDYERLELLGDAFLKYLASVYVFVTNPSLSEGALHVARQKIISNRSLLFHAGRIGMPAYIQSKVFAYKAWQPPNFRVYIPPKTPKEYTRKKMFAEGDPEKGTQEEGGKGSEVSGALPAQQEPEAEGDQAMVGIEEINPGTPLVVEKEPLTLIYTPSMEPIELEDTGIEFETNENDANLPSDEIDMKVSQEADKPELEEGEFEDGTKGEANAEIMKDGDDNESRDAKEENGVEVMKDPAVVNLDESGKVDYEDKTPKKKPKPKKKKTMSDDQGSQFLGDKAIADVAEAIIGAAYISGGREAALQVTKALTLPLSHIDRWSDFGRKVLTPPPNFTAKLRPGSIAAIETIIGHKFNRPHLLGQAMTHASIQGYEITSYERLEFIGDAILDFMVIRHIYDRDQQLSPGALTMLKGAMVSNSALAAVCVWSGLHEYLLFESSQLEYGIQSYVNELKEKKTQEYILAAQEGRTPGQYWLEIEPPKALSDVLESIIGAIYISDNFSPIGAECLFDNILKPFYDTHITLQTLSHHPTKILFELLQAQGCQQFELAKDKDETVTRCHILVHEVVLASGEDLTPATAARRASFCALDALEGDPDFMTRTCDCRTHQTHKKQRKKTEFEKALEKALTKSEAVEDQEEINEIAGRVEENLNDGESGPTLKKTEVMGGVV
ncbi:hypothetical protein CPB83DRAFT_901776 [Crepidotus variabilis]|uniref:Dicer n=1 Tax=Crepidotus variabilis TaxID=179855 RepID=A0A9P6JWN6_9AGAR|nr:hypothetical protein CPB83DRAFT_901776 [Crepidotus variabilis]